MISESKSKFRGLILIKTISRFSMLPASKGSLTKERSPRKKLIVRRATKKQTKLRKS